MWHSGFGENPQDEPRSEELVVDWRLRIPSLIVFNTLVFDVPGIEQSRGLNPVSGT
jgi:hypothetical protein